MAKQGPNHNWQAMQVCVKLMVVSGTVPMLHLTTDMSCRTSKRLDTMHCCFQVV